IGATNDRYVPASSQQRMQSLWGDRADYRWLPGGHVSSIAESSHVIDAITEALALD
ncbi:MAG: alpha/beta hydrolase family protein, partial [Betaproteobacteria bacterium]|nr:alpha/beta hydrolase family protein [Betaproteobacteria bacterium]